MEGNSSCDSSVSSGTGSTVIEITLTKNHNSLNNGVSSSSHASQNRLELECSKTPDKKIKDDYVNLCVCSETCPSMTGSAIKPEKELKILKDEALFPFVGKKNVT